ncbi:MAG: hypothetical protein D6771_03965, partial [Zetaproteobacteria bacterium]
EAIAFTEHDRQAIRFYLAPFRWLGLSYELPSLATTGVEAFFEDLARARRDHPEMVLLAGVEATPGYRWVWRPPWHWELHGAERHLIALGAERPEQVRRLPSFTLAGVRTAKNFSIAAWAALVALLLAFAAWRRRAWPAWLALVVAAAVAAGFVRAKAIADPEEAFIRAARSEGLFVAWAHPGTHSGVRPGPLGVQLITPPYTERVFTKPADGFAALYGDTDTLTEPGGAWDRWMLEWARGARPPVWAIAAGDFHREGEAGENLGNFPMDLWVRERSPQGVMDALFHGRAVAWGLPKDRDLAVRTLFLETPDGARLRPGDRTRSRPGAFALSIAIRDLKGRRPILLPLQVVVDGRAKTWKVRADGTLWREVIPLARGVHLVRVRMRVGALRMEANPMGVIVR